MKKSNKKDVLPAHVVIDLMAQGVFVNQGRLSISQMKRKMKSAQAKKKGGE